MPTHSGSRRRRRGEIVVDDDLTVPGHPDVFVIGDLAAAQGPRRPHASRSSRRWRCSRRRYVARTLDAAPRAAHRPFRYLDKGSMATIGRRSAVAELPLGIRFGGTLGWLSWLGLHLFFLVGFRNRIVVLVNWAWNYLNWDRGNRVIVRDDG